LEANRDISPPTIHGVFARARWYVLALLVVIYVLNVADRLILPVLAQNIKIDLQLSDWMLGLLIGPAVAFFYAILGLPMAYLADRVHRVRFLALCLAIWSVLTALGGLAANGLQLGLARIGVSAVEAGGSPATSSILADYFGPRERPFAMAFYAAASTVGVMVSFGVGGILNSALGWRWTLVAAGAPGIFLAAILLATVREPIRGSLDSAGGGPQLAAPEAKPLLASLVTLWRIPLYRWGVLGAGVSNFCFHAVLNWGPSFVIRKYALDSGHAGFSLGVGIGLCGGLAAIIGGRVTSRLVADGMAVPLRIASGLQFVGAPLMLGALFAPRLELCVVLMTLSYGVQAFFIPMYWSIAQSYVPPEIRAMAAAVLLLVAAVLGAGLSAPIVGALSDWLKPDLGNASLQYALAIGTPVNLVAALICLRASMVARSKR
jgi:MFS family permease